MLIKIFSPFGKIVGEDFLWHTRGPKRGEPRGYAFLVFSTRKVIYMGFCSKYASLTQELGF